MLKFLYDGRLGEIFAPTKSKDDLEKAITNGDLAACLDLTQSQRFDVVTHINEASGNTYLHLACQRGHREVAQMLLDRGKHQLCRCLLFLEFIFFCLQHDKVYYLRVLLFKRLYTNVKCPDYKHIHFYICVYSKY